MKKNNIMISELTYNYGYVSSIFKNIGERAFISNEGFAGGLGKDEEALRFKEDESLLGFEQKDDNTFRHYFLSYKFDNNQLYIKANYIDSPSVHIKYPKYDDRNNMAFDLEEMVIEKITDCDKITKYVQGFIDKAFEYNKENEQNLEIEKDEVER